MAKKSPTERTLHLFRKHGFIVDIAEHWNYHAGKRKDLFGFIDVVAVKPGFGTVAIQCTSDGCRSDRRKKILSEPRAATWHDAGNMVWLITWGKKGLKGTRVVWRPHIEELIHHRGDYEFRGIESFEDRVVPVVRKEQQPELPL